VRYDVVLEFDVNLSIFKFASHDEVELDDMLLGSRSVGGT
jgi:hypothetical protein